MLRPQPLAACLAAALSVSAAGAAAADVHTLRTLSTAPLSTLDGFRFSASRLPRLTRRRSATNFSAPQGAPFRVTNCSDGGPGSLRDAVESAVDAVDINFIGLACSTITLSNGAIHATHPVTLRGPGTSHLVIDGGYNNDRLFNADDDFKIYNLTLRNGMANGNGGCVLSQGNVYLTATTIEHCRAQASTNASGGAVFAAKSLSLVESTIASSNALSASGYASGGGIYAYALYALDTVIEGNSAHSGDGRGLGGGAFVAGVAYVNSSTVSGNNADIVGALALLSGGIGSSTLRNSTISNNSSNRHIGGVFSDGALNIRSSTVAFNCANISILQADYIAGVGVHTRFQSPSLRSSIIADNGFCVSVSGHTGADLAYDISTRQATSTITGDHNLVVTSTVALPDGTLRTDPQLEPLAANGGLTRTHALPATSPAIDTGFDYMNAEFDYDQRHRGSARVVGASADIGAYELQSTGVTHTVTNCADDGEGSLRGLAALASSGDSLDLRQLDCGTIILTSGAIDLPQGNVALIGPGDSALAIDGGQHSRIFNHTGYGTLRLEGFTVRNGSDAIYAGCVNSNSHVSGKDMTIAGCIAGSGASTGNSFCLGGGLVAESAELDHVNVTNNKCLNDDSVGGGLFTIEELKLLGSTVANNASSDAGGFFSYGNVDMANTTISKNVATHAFGGGFARHIGLINSTVSGNASETATAGIAGSYLDIFNSTIVANASHASKYGYGAGVQAYSGTQIESSIVFGNAMTLASSDLGGPVVTGSHNLIGTSFAIVPPDTLSVDPQLGPLQNNGGPTKTHAPAPGSPIIDAGSNSLQLTEDQRGSGFPRVLGETVDMGAIEAQLDSIFMDGFEPLVQ